MQVSHRQPQRTLSLVVPGLLARAPSTLPLPALLRLLARAQCLPMRGRSYEALMLALFGVGTDAGGDAPIAALARLGEDVPVTDGYWLRADPVHLYPDQARLLLFGPGTLAIRSDEAQQLGAAINRWYAEAGWQLSTPHPQRWYLRLPEPPDIRTHALADAAGNDINAFLPYGKAQGQWHAVLNEIQMLLHAHPVNVERTAQGLPAINSVWLWGGGELPQTLHADLNAVYSAEPLARGLAKRAAVPVLQPPPALTPALLAGDGSLLVTLPALSAALDDQTRAAALAALERDWFQPALTALKADRITTLIIYPCDGRAYALTRARLRRFWQRRRPLGSYVTVERDETMKAR